VKLRIRRKIFFNGREAANSVKQFRKLNCNSLTSFKAKAVPKVNEIDEVL